MARTVQPPPGVQIAALRTRKVAEVVDLMQAGAGTPWEQRGDASDVKGLLATALQSLTSPIKLVNAIHRPDTSGDARLLTIGLGVFWTIAVWTNALLLVGTKRLEGGGGFWIGTLVLSLIAPFALLLVLQVSTTLLYKFLSQELGRKAPPVLVYNVLAYSFGPGILAPIPLVGPVLAVLWIFVLVNVVAVKRLRVTPGSAIIAVCVISFLWCVAGVVAYYVLPWIASQIWHNIAGE